MSKFTEKMIALKPLRYNGEKHQADGIFYTTRPHSRLFKAMGKAKDAPRDLVDIPPMPESLKAATGYQTRHLQAAPASPETPAPAATYGAKVGKGPGGKFYIRRGRQLQSEGFETEAEAQAALDAANAVTPDGIPTPVPDAWEAMTDDELLALAAELSGGPVTALGAHTPVERARSIIQATVDSRS